jgi:L-alanine-DL-glutamate epimerase-like enolase superfamily enzyme
VSARLVDWGGSIPRIQNARTSWSERRGILLTLDGGHGEATPLPGYGGGALDDARRELSGVHVEELLALSELDDIASSITIETPSARFCLETALCDRLAQRAQVALADLLAGRRITRSVPRARAGILGEPAPPASALKLKARGLDLDLERLQLRELRDSVGDVELRLDLNGTLDLERARRALELYAEFGVRWVEEPVPGRALLDLGTTPVAWLADESLTDPALARELVECDGCAGVVVKPTLLGLFGAQTLARRALELGKVAIVSHAFEGPVALAACAELALSLELREAVGIDRHLALAAFPPCALPQLQQMEIRPVPRLGLGLTWQ